MKAKLVDLKGFQQVPISRLPFFEFAGDVETRWQRMNGILEEVLVSYKDPKILDVATGDGGHDTILLLKRGYDVMADEVNSEFIITLKNKMQQANVNTDILNIDWRGFLNSSELQDEAYDIVFSLGNSFPTYMFDESEREKSLKGFWRVLKPGGTLLFDIRNYGYMLNHAAEILEDPERNFKYSYQTTYLNRDIKSFPVEITSQKVRLIYKNYPKKRSSYLDVCPIKAEEVESLIEKILGDEAGLKIYYDYQTTKPESYDFIQYVLKKPQE